MKSLLLSLAVLILISSSSTSQAAELRVGENTTLNKDYVYCNDPHRFEIFLRDRSAIKRKAISGCQTFGEAKLVHVYSLATILHSDLGDVPVFRVSVDGHGSEYVLGTWAPKKSQDM